ncbi:hypothetical protein BCAH1134_C0591 (plasmid) [Bacillus cereus AH1134]|nr:hypothetical protein BCAH1134_C0591 [Bacillus cereus AH1134]
MKGTIIVHIVNYNIKQLLLIGNITINGIFVTKLLNILILKGFICM